MLNVTFLVQLNLCNILIKAANFAHFSKFSNNMASLIVSRVTNKMVLLRVDTVTLWECWDDAFVTAYYLINRMPTLLLKN
jgi:predicted Rdx family selenoprotein